MDIARNDEMGKVLQGLQSMQIQQGFNVAEAARIGDENLRIRWPGLRQQSVRMPTSTGASFTPIKGPAGRGGEMEDSLRAYIPGFRADQLVGSDVGRLFYRNCH